MLNIRILHLVILAILLSSCWPRYSEPRYHGKVWGYKPIYGSEKEAKKIDYSATARDTVVIGGNLYVYQNYIFQIEPGYGIHVIDNSLPANAKRIGFINVKGCTQISIKAGFIYINNFDDMVVLQFTGSDVIEYSRLEHVFESSGGEKGISQPPVSAYYKCPERDSFVIGWVQDSVNRECYRN